MIVQLIVYTLLAALAALLLADALAAAKEWTGRLRIGRYPDIHAWSSAITGLGAQWLNRTPRVKVTDNTRYVVLDMLRGNYSKPSIQRWQEGALLLGLTEYLEKTNDRETGREIGRFLARTFDRSGQWTVMPEHVDAALLAYAVMKAPGSGADRYKPALDAVWRLIRDHIGEDGTVMYRKSVGSYRYVDTIGFVCPFLAAYGIRYGKEECVELALRQLRAYERHGMLPRHYIPNHAYHAGGGLPLGLYGWGRGLAWFALGLLDTWRELPAERPERAELERMIGAYAAAILNFQQESGCWSWTITRRESRPDSSTTAVLGWFLLQASAAPECDAEACMRGASKAIRYLMKVTRRSGAVDFSQGDTKDIGVYSGLFTILPFTQGFCIRMVNGRQWGKAVQQ